MKLSRDVEERFWEKVDRGDELECWEWQAARSYEPFDYGRFNTGERTENAHRVAWRLWHDKDIPDDKHVCHSCDNPPCVNPNHLWLGNDQDNMRDAIEKGRWDPVTSGAKVDEDDVRTIRERYKNETASEVAADFDLHPVTVRRIAAGMRWGHVD